MMTETPPLNAELLPDGVRARFVPGVNGLRMHVLEAGFEEAGRPCVLLLHGFPELAYSWRKVMPAIAAAGFHVVAPDQRGYGRTTGWDSTYDGDVASFRLLALVKDALALVLALRHRSVAAVVGHDFGSPVAALCALIRPDVFRSVVLMSAPFPGAPSLPFGTGPSSASADPGAPDIHAELAALERPRKHYQWYYSTREAEPDMLRPVQGLHDFLRAYYHVKSADWAGNDPFPLTSWTASELAKLPTYYVMDLDADMPATVRPYMPSGENVAGCAWLPDVELAVYASEFQRTGFQAALNWYRCGTEPAYNADLEVFSGRTIDVPSCFIAGRSDWGIYQRPGALDRMSAVCTRFKGVHLVDGAGHWVQQERPREVESLVIEFLSAGERRAPQTRT
jgi:pimeloyl-ACP methyl ester carboxylesterase